MHKYIAIEGVIGVGKTTLARLLQRELGGDVLLEEFEENPFLSSFYADRQRYAFQTQIFFLLSRYRQMSTRLAGGLLAGPVSADYAFAKDRLFAHLNLAGDELAVYERLYSALGEHMRRPDLLVYLRADHDVLMQRIIARDRPFERNIDPAYIERLRLAYEDFAAGYEDGPLLVIDTNDLNIVADPDALAGVVERIKSRLQLGVYQAALPGVTEGSTVSPQAILQSLEERPNRLADFQQFHLSLDAEKGFDPDLYFNFVLLSEEIGELARVIKQVRQAEARARADGLPAAEAFRQAIGGGRADLQDELADCLAYLLKLSNYAGIDLEQAYLAKMAINTRKQWEN